eukprot:scaffold25750_cov146-Isochrysis_galbana.AAC.4
MQGRNAAYSGTLKQQHYAGSLPSCDLGRRPTTALLCSLWSKQGATRHPPCTWVVTGNHRKGDIIVTFRGDRNLQLHASGDS